MTNATKQNQAKQIKKDVLKNSSKNQFKESPIKTATRRNSSIENQKEFSRKLCEEYQAIRDRERRDLDFHSLGNNKPKGRSTRK